MSLYKNYLLEKTKDKIIETSHAFATYRYLDHQGIKAVYIVDIYVEPDFRNSNVASSISDNIAREASILGCKYLLGSVVPSNKESTSSIRVLLAYGMSLDSSSNDFILFKKDI